jgi:hypothetical protein
MTAVPPRRPALLRGAAVGALTAALALAAHGTAAGVFPAGGVFAQVLVLAGAVAVPAAVTRPGLGGLLAMLAAGQAAGHQLLGVDGHAHAQLNPAVMLAAHIAAVVGGALLIGAGERLGAALSRTVAAICGPASPRVPPAASARRRAGQPLQSALLVRASISHRGPPVAA